MRKCYKKIGFKRFFKRHLEIRGLEKSELELFLKAQLMFFEITNEKINNETVVTCNDVEHLRLLSYRDINHVISLMCSL